MVREPAIDPSAEVPRRYGGERVGVILIPCPN